MHEKATYVYIPPNIGGADGGTALGGAVSVRNLVETGVAILLTLFLKLLISKIVPFAIVGWIVIIAGLGLCLACFTGVNGEPLSIFIVNIINYNNRRVFVTLRPPVPKKKEETSAFEEGIDQKIMNIFSKKTSDIKEKEESK